MASVTVGSRNRRRTAWDSSVKLAETLKSPRFGWYTGVPRSCLPPGGIVAGEKLDVQHDPATGVASGPREALERNAAFTKTPTR